MGRGVHSHERRWRGSRSDARHHPVGLAACGETHAAFERRSIPPKQPVVKPTRPSSPGGGSAGDPSRLNRVATRRSSLRFGRNTPGIPPSRALSAGRLTSLGAHVGPPPAVHRAALRRSALRFGRNTLGIPPSRALSAGRLAPRCAGRTGRSRRSPGFHQRLLAPRIRRMQGAGVLFRRVARCGVLAPREVSSSNPPGAPARFP